MYIHMCIIPLYMYKYIYIYIYAHTHTHIYIYIHTHIHIYIYIYTQLHEYMHNVLFGELSQGRTLAFTSQPSRRPRQGNCHQIWNLESVRSCEILWEFCETRIWTGTFGLLDALGEGGPPGGPIRKGVGGLAAGRGPLDDRVHLLQAHLLAHRLAWYGGFYFVCDHGKHRNAKRYNFGCNFVIRYETKVTPKTAPFSETDLIINVVALHKQSRNPHVRDAGSQVRRST